MGNIIIETPQGNVQIEIEGDTPNEKEKKAIMDKFFPQPSIKSKAPGIDLAKASPEEIEDYARKMRLSGIDPLTNEVITEDEFIRKYKEPGVDYSTGLDSVGGFSRFGFGRMDTDEERAVYLTDKVGKDGFRQDALGRFILTKKGRKALGMEDGKELAIDEEGLTFNDIKDFAGATAAPIGAAIGASLMASGVGFFPGIALVGAAGFTGKVFDEAVEYTQGYQRQNFSELLRDSAIEGAFALAGEGVGRGISKFIGRLIKGPAGETEELLRAQARKIIEKQYRPTIAGATNESFRPILNRLQSIYEGVFPNQKAAMDNLKIAMKELKGIRGVNPKNIKDLEQSVADDIIKYFESADDQLVNAQIRMNKAVENEIKDIMSKLIKDSKIPKKLQQKILLSKSVFDRDVDALYTAANKALKGATIVSTKGIKKELEKLVQTSAANIKGTKFYKDVNNLGEFATPAQVNIIRQQISHATNNPQVFNDVNVRALGSLKGSIDDALLEAEKRLAFEVYGDPIYDAGFKTSTILRGSLRGTKDQQKKGLSLLRRTNQFYRKGMERYDKVSVTEILKEAKKGNVNYAFIYDKIITPDNPEALGQLLRAIRGTSGKIKNIDRNKAANYLKNQMIGLDSVEEALKKAQALPDGDPTKKFILQEVQRLEREALEINSVTGRGAEIAEEVRQNLGRIFLEKQVENSIEVSKLTGQAIINPVKLSTNLSKLGETNKVLFRNELKQLEDLTAVLNKGKAKLAPSVFQSIKNRPLGQALKDFEQAQKLRADIDQGNLFANIRNAGGDPDKIVEAVFKNPQSIRVAKEVFKNNPKTLSSMQDAAMGRILKDAGVTLDDLGNPMLGTDFIESFKSGAFGSKLNSVVGKYGTDTLDEMFGKGAGKALNNLSEEMIAVSNAATAGKGGLAAPTIALSLTLFGVITAPLATLPTALGFMFMSRMLRNPTVLRIMMASRKPGADKIGQIAQIAQTIAAQVQAQSARGLVEQTAEEAKPITEEMRQQLAPQINQMKSNLSSQINPPSAASSPGGVSPLGTNPIVNPNPTTQALAQSLQARSP